MPDSYENPCDEGPDSLITKYTIRQLDSINDVVRSFKEVMKKTAADDPKMREFMPLSMQPRTGKKSS